MKYSKQEELYLNAKEKYYLGEEIMTDAEFDELEADLKQKQSKVILIVGFSDRNLKFPHPTPMLSLAKYQADKLTGVAPIDEATAWLKSRIVGNQISFEYSPKYDGNAVNIIYVNGKLHLILSRGTGIKGRDYTPKLRKHVPLTVPFRDTLEVRAEVVIPISLFDSKYGKDNKNARNYVAGVLNRTADDPSIIDGTVLDELVVMCHEIKHTEGKTSEYIQSKELSNLGFNKNYPLISYYYPVEGFETAYNKMKDYRETKSPFLLDGIVIKVAEKYRKEFGENSHHPEWAIAIKFPPKDARTVIKDIQWNYGKTGALTPVAIMEPVDLDGTTVTRASMYNYAYVVENKVYPGAIVSIAKAGDIIPVVIKVNTPGDASIFTFPTHCKYCGTKLEIINKKHLTCINENCSNTKFKLFEESVNFLGLFGIGGSIIKDIWDANFKNATLILDKELFNEKSLINSGKFQKGKTLDNLLFERNKIKEIHLQTVIRLMGFKRMGTSTSKQIALQIANEDFSYKGLEKTVVAGFGENEPKRILVENEIKRISKFVKIIYPEVIKGKIKVEFTGSPSGAGFKTKSAFTDFIKAAGVIHTKLNEADYLITDDLNSSSSKMKTAIKNGIKIVSYEEFLNIIK